MQADDDTPLSRAFAVIDFVASQRKALTATEISEGLALPTPSVHRLIGNLEERGLLQRALASKRYVLGNKMVLLGSKAISAGFRTARRHALLQEVSQALGEQCEIGVVENNYVSYIDSVRVGSPAGLQFDPGMHVPIHCTSTGKIYMSELSRKEREKLIQSLPLTAHTDRTITSEEALLKEVESTRKRGWAKSNEEFVKGVVGCAVPIFGPKRALIACLGISVPIARITFEELDDVIPKLQAAAGRLAKVIVEDENPAEEIVPAA